MDASPRRPLRVAVTGIGAVSAWGWGRDALARGLQSSDTAIRGFARFDHARHRTHVAAEVPPIASSRLRAWPRLSFADRFAVFAALEAVAQAGLDPLPDPDAAGLYFASSTGGLYESEVYLDLARRGSRPRGDLLASQQLNAPGDAVARELGVRGPVITISAACASATLALEAALRDLRAGRVDIAIAGGADSLCQITYAGFNALRAVDERPCRPFRAQRAGMSMGEGAGVMILETEARVAARAGAPLAELRGAGSSCDAGHMTAPDPAGAGAALAIARALDDAWTDPADVRFVNAHGTGTPLNDVAESNALQAVFGERKARLPLSATKASVGHLLGAAGAIEAVATVLFLADRAVPPTAGDGEADPELGVDLVLGCPRPVAAGPAVSTNLAFGGANAVVVLDRWSEA